jgi:cyanate permease
MTTLDRADNASDEEAAAAGEVRRWRAFSLLAVSYFMTVVDLTIVNVALPTLGRKLHFPESDLQWVVTAYSLTFGGFLLLGAGPPTCSAAGGCSWPGWRSSRRPRWPARWPPATPS